MIRNIGAVSAQKKIISVADKFGNRGIKRQQGTTRILYDTIPIDGRDVFRFFEGSNNRDFPLTNVGANGNRLNVGEALAVERAHFSILEIDPATNEVTSIDSLTVAGLASIEGGELQFEIANNIVMKPIPILSFDPQFNKNAYWDDYNNFEFDTQIVIQPLLEFVFPLRVTETAAIDDTFIRLTIEGIGAIISPRQTM